MGRSLWRGMALEEVAGSSPVGHPLICRKTLNPKMNSSILYCKARLFREIDITRKADASLKQSNDKFNSKMITPLPRHCTIARINTG
jgi:hypothetical protein